jgi:hypothetical protein
MARPWIGHARGSHSHLLPCRESVRVPAYARSGIGRTAKDPDRRQWSAEFTRNGQLRSGRSIRPREAPWLRFHLRITIDLLRDPSRWIRVLGSCERASRRYISIQMALDRFWTHLRMGLGSSLVKYSCSMACAAVILFIGSNSNNCVRSL